MRVHFVVQPETDSTMIFLLLVVTLHTTRITISNLYNFLDLSTDQKEPFTARNMVWLKSSTHMQQTRSFTLRRRLMVSKLIKF